MLLGKLRLKLYQEKFCRKYVEKVSSIKGYNFYLRNLSKNDDLNNHFMSVSLYDMLDNNGMNKLIKKLYALEKDKNYKIRTYFRKPGLQKLNYISQTIGRTSVGSVGEIILKNNNWLSKILISYTYLNNSEVIIEYEFIFKKIMCTYQQIHNFVMNYVCLVEKEWYFHSYADKNFFNSADCREIVKLEYIFFADILQAFICGKLYTTLGRKYKLPIEYCNLIKKYNKNKAKKLRKVFLSECYEKEKEYLIVSDFIDERMEIGHFCTGKYFPNPIMLRLFADFSCETYYKIFYHIELEELERRMRKYLNYNRTFILAKDLKWFANKIRNIDDCEERIKDKVMDENKKYVDHLMGWELYIHGEKRKEDFVNYPHWTEYFKDLYKQNLGYLNSISLVQNNSIIIWVAVASLVATIIGILLSLFNVEVIIQMSNSVFN